MVWKPSIQPEDMFYHHPSETSLSTEVLHVAWKPDWKALCKRLNIMWTVNGLLMDSLPLGCDRLESGWYCNNCNTSL